MKISEESLERAAADTEFVMKFSKQIHKLMFTPHPRPDSDRVWKSWERRKGIKCGRAKTLTLSEYYIKKLVLGR